MSLSEDHKKEARALDAKHKELTVKKDEWLATKPFEKLKEHELSHWGKGK